MNKLNLSKLKYITCCHPVLAVLLKLELWSHLGPSFSSCNFFFSSSFNSFVAFLILTKSFIYCSTLSPTFWDSYGAVIFASQRFLFWVLQSHNDVHVHHLRWQGVDPKKSAHLRGSWRVGLRFLPFSHKMARWTHMRQSSYSLNRVFPKCYASLLYTGIVGSLPLKIFHPPVPGTSEKSPRKQTPKKSNRNAS